jgi:hypothetical protein
MGSLRDLANRALSVERPVEQQVEQVEQSIPPFQSQSSCSATVERLFPEKSAINGECSSVPRPRERNAGTLPSDLAASLSRLPRLPCPPGVKPDSWRAVILDCQRLVDENWAAEALSLGWSVLDLFGAVTDKQGDPNGDGLAVKLGGRPLVALCASFATVRDGPSSRTYLYRGRNAGARLLWELGNERR